MTTRRESYGPGRFRAATALLLPALGGCRDDDRGKKDAPAETTAEEEPAAATTPVDVTGAYLVDCSAATGPTYVEDPTVSASLTACIVRDKARAPVEIEAPTVTVAAEGQTVTPALVPKETAYAWNVGFTLPPEVLATLKEIRVDFKAPDGTAQSVTTGNAGYDWSNDEAFSAAMEFVRLIHDTFSPAVPLDKWGA